MLEFDDPGADAKLIDELRSTSIFTVLYFSLGICSSASKRPGLSPADPRAIHAPVGCSPRHWENTTRRGRQ